MAKVKVAVYGSPLKTVYIDTSLGARLDALQAELNALKAARSTTRHSSLQGLQIGDDHPQYTMWQARETIVGQWDFTQQVWASLGDETAPGYAFTASTGTGLFADVVEGDPFFNDVSLLFQPAGPDGSTTFTDLSIYANTLTAVSGAQQTTTNPKFPGTASLNGNASAYVRTDAIVDDGPLDLPINGDFTVEFWVRFNDLVTLTSIARLGTTAGCQVYLDSGVVTVQFSVSYGWGALTAANPIVDNDWHHVAFTRSGNTGRLFIDGVIQSSTTTTTWTGAPDMSGQYRLGAFPFTPLDGALYGFRVTTGVARYTASFDLPTEPYLAVAGDVFTSISVDGDEKFRFGLSGQLGIGGDNFGTLRQSFLSGGPGAAATWSTLEHTDISDWDEAVQDVVGAMAVDSSSINFTYDDLLNTLTAAVIYANPTASIGLTAVNGSAATAMRSDAAPAINPGIAPTWTGKHIFSAHKTLVPTDAVTGGYLAHNPTLPEATLDSIVTGVGNLYAERLMRAVRSTSPVLGGLAYGAALTASTPQAVASGNVLVDFRGSGYRDNTFSTLTDGMSWVAQAIENWDSTHAGTEALVNLIPAASTSQVTVLALRNTYLRLPIDNQEVQIGAGQDLRLYHDGADSYIENDTGNLVLRVGGELALEEVTTSTGAVTCTLGTNAPAGVGTTTPTTWMKLLVGGTEYFIPLWT